MVRVHKTFFFFLAKVIGGLLRRRTNEFSVDVFRFWPFAPSFFFEEVKRWLKPVKKIILCILIFTFLQSWNKGLIFRSEFIKNDFFLGTMGQNYFLHHSTVAKGLFIVETIIYQFAVWEYLIMEWSDWLSGLFNSKKENITTNNANLNMRIKRTWGVKGFTQNLLYRSLF